MKIRKSIVDDGKMFRRVLMQEGTLEYFPMINEREVDDAVRVWEIFCKQGASLTAEIDGVACGIAYLNIQPYQKFAHQCLITIIVDEVHRGKGIGTTLLNELKTLAQETFSLEMIHLEVYEENPAKSLYERQGFKEFGIQKKFIKHQNRFVGKILMELWF